LKGEETGKDGLCVDDQAMGEGRKRRAEVAGLGEMEQRPASVGWSWRP